MTSMQSDALLTLKQDTLTATVETHYKELAAPAVQSTKYVILSKRAGTTNTQLFTYKKDDERVQVFIWNLVRELLLDIVTVYVWKEAEDVLKNCSVPADAKDPKVGLKALRLGLECMKIDADGAVLDISKVEFEQLLPELIKVIATTSGTVGTIWGVLRHIMAQFFLDFSTDLFMPVTNLPGMTRTGLFRVQNPYKPEQAVIPYTALHRVELSIPPSSQLVSSTSIAVEQRLPSALANELVKVMTLKDHAYGIYYPKTAADYTLRYFRTPQYPELARNYEVSSPSWLNVTATHLATELRDPDKSEDVGKSLKLVAATTRSYLASAWQWLGRRECKASISLLESLPVLTPGVVVLVEVQPQRYYTGYVNSVSMTWKASGTYDIMVNVSHWTSVNDLFYGSVVDAFYTPKEIIIAKTESPYAYA